MATYHRTRAKVNTIRTEKRKITSVLFRRPINIHRKKTYSISKTNMGMSLDARGWKGTNKNDIRMYIPGDMYTTYRKLDIRYFIFHISEARYLIFDIYRNCPDTIFNTTITREHSTNTNQNQIRQTNIGGHVVLGSLSWALIALILCY